MGRRSLSILSEGRLQHEETVPKRILLAVLSLFINDDLSPEADTSESVEDRPDHIVEYPTFKTLLSGSNEFR